MIKDLQDLRDPLACQEKGEESVIKEKEANKDHRVWY